jgi:hypothetical protein
MHGFQLHLLNRPSGLAFDDDCRWAVSHLNTLRLQRAENLGDGYEVSDILYYNIDQCYINCYQRSVLKNWFTRQPSETFLLNTWTV